MGVRYADRQKRERQLREELAGILPRIVDDDTEKVILFGSTARRAPGSTSDLDLLVIRRDSRPPAVRIDEVYRRARPRLALDVLVYTPEELEAARATSSFLRTALRDGEVVYERGRTLAHAGAPRSG